MASLQVTIALVFLLSSHRSTVSGVPVTASYSTEPCYDNSVVSLPCLKKLIAERNIQLFDVRTRKEIEETGKIPGATNIPLDEVRDAFSLTPDEFEKTFKVPKPGKDDGNITFYCRTGRRAKKAIKIIQELGYKRYQSNQLLLDSEPAIFLH
ncbi:hypothetical protein QZH41_018579 [Actinostola sp. cb2023]|nr:hypothetical protein QZH41_018579 [Actinostola sp. cb2023]